MILLEEDTFSFNRCGLTQGKITVKNGTTQLKGQCLKSGSFIAGDDQSSVVVDQRISSNPLSYRVFMKTPTLETEHKLEQNDQRIGRKVADQ